MMTLELSDVLMCHNIYVYEKLLIFSKNVRDECSSLRMIMWQSRSTFMFCLIDKNVIVTVGEKICQ